MLSCPSLSGAPDTDTKPTMINTEQDRCTHTHRDALSTHFSFPSHQYIPQASCHFSWAEELFAWHVLQILIGPWSVVWLSISALLSAQDRSAFVISRHHSV